jgi:hypothetical protein
VVPGDTELLPATLVTTKVGHWTTIAMGPTEPVPPLPEVYDAELLTVPQLAVEVGEPMCTDRLLPEARDVPLPPHVSTPSEIPQVQPAETELVVHVNEPGVVGSVSVIVTFVAVPVPATPELETVIV